LAFVVGERPEGHIRKALRVLRPVLGKKNQRHGQRCGWQCATRPGRRGFCVASTRYRASPLRRGNS